MSVKKKTYFVADVHLGSTISDPVERQARFVSFLRSINSPQTESLYLLGDIWDFWYEYKYVVPKQYFQVFAAIEDLIKSEIAVYFIPGNHDVWTYSYFEEIGMKKLSQPYRVEIGGRTFCLGHGDCLGKVPFVVHLLTWLFHNKVAQFLFSMLHPRIAFSFGDRWSRGSRKRHLKRNDPKFMNFKVGDLPIYGFAQEYLKDNSVDYFIFGHYHLDLSVKMPEGAEFFIVKDWYESSPYLVWDTMTVFSGYFQNME